MLSGFLTSPPVLDALLIAAAAAMMSGVIGVFAVLRGQSFAGHALADVSSAGGALAALCGFQPMLGFLGLSILGGLGLGGRRQEEGDFAAGILLGAGLGLTALLLHFAVSLHGTAGAAVAVMFGSLFTVPPGAQHLALGAALGGFVLLAVIHRPLLLASLDEELARVRGVRTGLIGGLYMLLLALSVTLSAMSVGAILSTALLIGPAASSLRLTRRPWAACALAAGIGLICSAGGIALAYASYGWMPGRSWPVSFFIVALVLLAYAAASLRR